MKHLFIVSLCWKGFIGGGIRASEEGLRYKTGKVTFGDSIRNIVMNYADIDSISDDKYLGFPVFKVTMKDGNSYSFLVFNRKRFRKLAEEKGLYR